MPIRRRNLGYFGVTDRTGVSLVAAAASLGEVIPQNASGISTRFVISKLPLFWIRGVDSLFVRSPILFDKDYFHPRATYLTVAIP